MKYAADVILYNGNCAKNCCALIFGLLCDMVKTSYCFITKHVNT